MAAGVIDEGTAQAAQKAFVDGTDAALLCADGCKTDNICVMHLQEYDYVLVQAFPKNVTQTMISRANMAGVMLEICLLVLFAVYVIYMLFRAAGRRKELEVENKLRGDVLRGVNILFASRYMIVDLESDGYAYLTGVGTLNTRIPMEGVTAKS